MADIAEILFREILGMTSYPGSPFTGEIFRDIILFFFVPTVVIIIFVYIASAIVVAPENRRLHLLMSLALYAFIVASRYYEGFAIFASQFYFVFVIFLGALFFIRRHFRRPGGRMAYGGGGGGRKAYEGYEGGGHGGGNDLRDLFSDERKQAKKELNFIQGQIRTLESRLPHSTAEEAAKIQTLLAGYRKQEFDLKEQIAEMGIM